jgi:hypothetical protein
MDDGLENSPAPPVTAWDGVRSAGCKPGEPGSMRFRFNLPGGEQVEKCFWHALVHRPMVRRALLTALVVGTILTAINQGDLLAAGDFKQEMLWKIPLTFCVPYSVVTFSSLGTARLR